MERRIKFIAPDVHKEAIDLVREQGWAEDRGEFVEGVRAVAAPVFDAEGALAGTVSVTYVAGKTERSGEILKAVLAAAAEISFELGAPARRPDERGGARVRR